MIETAAEVGNCHFDCAYEYRNQEGVRPMATVAYPGHRPPQLD
jgi:hypothetical protein